MIAASTTPYVALPPGDAPSLEALPTVTALSRSIGDEPSRTAARVRPLWLPIAISVAVTVSALFAVAPLRDAVTLRDAPGAHLVRPTAYVALAPVSDVLDALTLLSERQHVALVLGAFALWAVWRYALRRGPQYGLRSHAASFSLLAGSIVAAFAAAVLLPRPMAALASSDPDVVRIDFHSHTSSSKDAHRSFSVDRSRRWHADGGYDVAYVTDHDTFAAADGALAGDPRPGTGGVVLLPGVEVSWKGEHVGLLGSADASRGEMSANLHDFDPRRATSAVRPSAREPLVVWNHPRDPRLATVPLARGVFTDDVRAIEVSNGAPHGMDLVRWKRPQIVALAREHDLAPVAGSDTHGWGRAAPNWTLMRIPGWRALAPNALADRIAREIRDHGFEATRVVERAAVDPGASVAALALTVVVVPWRMLTTLSPAERAVWLVWTWALAGAALRWGRRRVPALRPASAPVP